jgi:hypothetical protein
MTALPIPSADRKLVQVAVPGHDMELLRPECTALRFAHGENVDVGALCYLATTKGAANRRHVVQSSFEPRRRKDVRKVVSYVSELLGSGCRSTSVAARLRCFLRFIRWADSSMHAKALRGEKEATEAFASYVTHLRERLRQGEITLITANLEQQETKNFLAGLLDLDTFARGLTLLVKDSRSCQVTVPPSEEAQSKVLALCGALFNGITTFVLGGLPYPHLLSMPQYLDWGSAGLWLFPAERMFSSPDEAPDLSSRNGGAFDYMTGALLTHEELRLRGPVADHRRRSIESAHHRIGEANSNRRHIYRLRLAEIAHGAFFLMFLAQTGMNLAQAKTLRWADDYAVGAERQHFRAIKARAGGRQVVFEIPTEFLNSFKRFLALRQFLCAESSSDWLFPHRPDKMIFGAYRQLRRIDPQLPQIAARQWRAAKSDWLLRHTDVSTTALVLQNSERTVLKAYAGGTESGHLEEMTSFLAQVSAAVVPADDVLERSSPCAIGSCTEQGNPVAIQPLVPATPDCRKTEGCLFCDKFRVHADERDTRKLLSCRYCIEQTSHLFQSEEQYQTTAGPVLARIEQLVAEIGKRDPAMVTNVSREVLDEGELDPYWASTMQMFMELGVVR